MEKKCPICGTALEESPLEHSWAQKTYWCPKHKKPIRQTTPLGDVARVAPVLLAGATIVLKTMLGDD